MLSPALTAVGHPFKYSIKGLYGREIQLSHPVDVADDFYFLLRSGSFREG
jgi:hypothetical protein